MEASPRGRRKAAECRSAPAKTNRAEAFGKQLNSELPETASAGLANYKAVTNIGRA